MAHTFFPPKPLPESDLACERSPTSICGSDAIYHEREWEELRLSALTLTEAGGRRVGKPCGRYLSIAFPPPVLWSQKTGKHISDALAATLAFFLSPLPSRVLVAGLGNRRLTADTFGPLTADGVTASAALPEALRGRGLLSPVSVSVCVPDVFPRTGIDSVRSVAATARLAEAEAVIVLDALAAAERDRLLSVLEITDTGTVPGSGVKRGGSALCTATLGCPVLSCGLPTVIRADEEHFVVPRDLETGVAEIAGVVASGINAIFSGEMPTLPFSIEMLFSKEES